MTYCVPAFFLCAITLLGAEWSDPVEVHYDEKRCVTYRAQWTGGVLEVQATLDPGWHTFAMDNKERQREKLAGKPSLGIEKATEIEVGGGLAATGTWLQSPPKNFSKPELRYYSWGFDNQAVFAVKARPVGSGPARITVRGQACSDAICKNIDIPILLPVTSAKRASAADLDLKSLIPVR
ncbi:MAG: protein-disulfide reductase DsbD N-terminal domain-containing protein [Acidobacteriota bacterium]|nr:protein-disulfide reductase DsbD N-terminal domain-containing protein [Acidobacteriota bacterium]